MSRDNIYQQQDLSQVVAFEFDDKVVAVFPDMINRSVPGYATIIKMTGILAAELVTENSCCYDLGASLGASSLSMAQHIQKSGVHIFAVDNSAAMHRQLNIILAQNPPQNCAIEPILADIQDIPIHNASLVVLNFTLQFIAPEQRQDILNCIYAGINPGGALILSEKISLQHPKMQQLFIDMHHQFKSAQGYSQLEIAAKRSALEHVLLPETIATHQQRLLKAGFSDAQVWFNCLNFCSILAIK